MFNKEEIKSTIYGAVVGDALGAPYEFFKPKELADKTIDMNGGTSRLMVLRPGEWTDDTEMTLMLAETISKGLPIDFNQLANRYIAWADSMPKDIGTTTRQALAKSSGFKESTKRAADFYQLTKRSSGNGTIMRSSPLAFLPVDDNELFDIVKVESAITHGSPEAAETSYLQAVFIRQLLRDGQINLHQFIETNFTDNVLAVFEEYEDEDYVAREVALGGTCWSSLAVSMHSLKFDTYADGVKWAISIGYDTDTNASCAGALLGARDRFNSIPTDWVNKLEDKQKINQAIDGLVKIQS
jgi:ADP-ribosyl-[dinitrogen reductase] hydrolase